MTSKHGALFAGIASIGGFLGAFMVTSRDGFFRLMGAFVLGSVIFALSMALAALARQIDRAERK